MLGNIHSAQTSITLRQTHILSNGGDIEGSVIALHRIATCVVQYDNNIPNKVWNPSNITTLIHSPLDRHSVCCWVVNSFPFMTVMQVGRSDALYG